MIITIRNGRCLVQANKVESFWLGKLLTVPSDKKNSRGQVIPYHFYKPQEGWFPTGLLPRVLTECQYPMQLVDERKKLVLPAEPVPIQGFEYRDYQRDGLRLMLKQKRGTVEVATNGGKSLMLAGILKTIEETYPDPNTPRALVLVHRKEIFDQLDDLLSQTLKPQIGRITSKHCSCRHARVTLAMISTLINRIGSYKHVTEFFEQHQILLADEAHHLQAKTWYDLFLNSDAAVRIGFSGTIPPDDSYAGARVRAATGGRIINVTNQELIEAGHSADTSVEMLSHDSSKRFPKTFYKAACIEYSKTELNGESVFSYKGGFANATVRGKFFSWYQRKCIDVGMINNTPRTMAFIRRIRERPDKQHLVIAERLKHGENILTILKDLGEDAAFIHGNAKDRDKQVQKFRDGKLRILVASTILDEGVDIDRIDVLVLAGCMKSNRAIKQRLGRSLRKKKHGANVAKVIDMKDKGNKYLERYSEEREKIWESEGIPVEYL
jgi:superfamily II DNA or RNA helicase